MDSAEVTNSKAYMVRKRFSAVTGLSHLCRTAWPLSVRDLICLQVGTGALTCLPTGMLSGQWWLGHYCHWHLKIALVPPQCRSSLHSRFNWSFGPWSSGLESSAGAHPEKIQDHYHLPSTINCPGTHSVSTGVFTQIFIKGAGSKAWNFSDIKCSALVRMSPCGKLKNNLK